MDELIKFWPIILVAVQAYQAYLLVKVKLLLAGSQLEMYKSFVTQAECLKCGTKKE